MAESGLHEPKEKPGSAMNGEVNARRSSENADLDTADSAKEQDFTKGKPWRFWAIFPSLMITTLLSAMEVTVVSTAMPSIVHDLDIGKNYVWIINSFVLTR